MNLRRLAVFLISPLLCLGASVLSVRLEKQAVRTPFDSAFPLFAPSDREGFYFVVLGDRTQGEDWGLPILRQAVAEINRIDPDLVMTVGDLINGYNDKEAWLAQMVQYKEIMSELDMEWYPVAGNHDVYGKDGDPRDRGNEGRYLEHFGPLYYSFDHRFAHFVVLYSDEQLAYDDPPKNQRMSDAQLQWLENDLHSTSSEHVFVFLHHPRWNYEGNPWEPVHQVLAKSGKVRAVFAGHWHRYRSDGERNGIRYYLMAATGAVTGSYRKLGDLHHFNLVSVRRDGWTMGAIPVGSVIDKDFVTGRECDEALRLTTGDWIKLGPALAVETGKDERHPFTATLTNSSSKELDCALRWSTRSASLMVTPPSTTVKIPPGGRQSLDFQLAGVMGDEEHPFVAPELAASFVYPLDKGGRQSLTATAVLPVTLPAPTEEQSSDDPAPPIDRFLELNGTDAYVVVPHHGALELSDPFTIECWARIDRSDRRQGLIAKTEKSAYGLFASDRESPSPSFLVFVEGSGYARAQAPRETGSEKRWVHLAGVYDHGRARFFVGGRCCADLVYEGKVRNNSLPLMIGADVNGKGNAVDFAAAAIDEVRISRSARYGKEFNPERRLRADGDTILLLHFDKVIGNRTPDCSACSLHGELHGGALLRPRTAPDR